MKKSGFLTSIGVVVSAIALGCGAGGDTSVSLPSPGAIAACFRQEGLTSVYQKEERGVPFINGLAREADAVSAELTGDRAKTIELLERYEADESTGLEAFEVLEGAAVGVVTRESPAANKQIVLNCLE